MKPGNILLEKYRLGELTEDETQLLKQEYPDQDELDRETARLKVSDAEILDKYSPGEMSELIKEKIRSDKKFGLKNSGIKRLNRFKVLGYTAGAAAAVLVLVFGLSIYTPSTTSGSLISAEDSLSSERVKGLNPSLKVYRRSGDTAEILVNRDSAVEKDLLQIEYIAGSFKYGVIFSIDGRGTLTMHFPAYSGVSAELDNNGAVLLPYAYELDDAPDFERFFFVVGGSGFDLNEVFDAACELASKGNAARREFLDIPESYYQTTLLLKKAGK